MPLPSRGILMQSSPRFLTVLILALQLSVVVDAGAVVRHVHVVLLEGSVDDFTPYWNGAVSVASRRAPTLTTGWLKAATRTSPITSIPRCWRWSSPH
jgi:hypothetical protein